MGFTISKNVGAVVLLCFGGFTSHLILWQAYDRHVQTLFRQHESIVRSLYFQPKGGKTRNGAMYLHDESKQNPFQWRHQIVRFNSSNPLFVIHPGPSKTATSTMQNDLRTLHSVLAQDNYVYLGVRRGRHNGVSHIHPSFVHKTCLLKMRDVYRNKNGTTYREFPCWNRVYDEIRKWRKTNTSIIVSEEIVSNMESPLWDPDTFAAFASALKEALADEWNVLTVVGYRRFGEWMSSSIKQIHALYCLKYKEKWAHSKCRDSWPYVKSWLKRNPPSAKNFRYTPQVVSLWQSEFPVKILNYHSPGDITEKLVCDILPNTRHTCNYTRMRTVPAQNFNVRSSVESAISSLAWIARNSGIISMDKPRSEVLEEAKQYNLEISQFPLACPLREQVENLLNLSLSLEEQILPDFFRSPLVEMKHRESFWYLVDEKKEFCSLGNVDGLLRGKNSWTEVLQALVARNGTG